MFKALEDVQGVGRCSRRWKMFKALEDVQGAGRWSRRWKMVKIVKMFTGFAALNALTALTIFGKRSQGPEARPLDEPESARLGGR